MMLYNKNLPQDSKKAMLKGCLSLIISLGILASLPYLGIWVLNVLRQAGGQDKLNYDLSNWAIAFVFVLVIILIITKVRKLK